MKKYKDAGSEMFDSYGIGRLGDGVGGLGFGVTSYFDSTRQLIKTYVIIVLICLPIYIGYSAFDIDLNDYN